ncbi:MAG: MFS transporter [Thermoleophilia bacterium]
MRASPFKLLCSAGLFAVFSSTISKSPALPLFAVHLGAAPSSVGVIAGISAFTGIIASIPAGMLSDRVGRKRMLLVSGLVFAGAPFAYLAVATLWQLALLRFFHGLATAIFVPVSMALVADLFQGGRGEKLGWFSTSTLLGRFIAPIAGGSIIGVLAFSPDWSFRAVYLVCAAAGVIALLLIVIVPAPVERKEKPVAWRDSLALLRSVFARRGIMITAAVEAAILFAYGAFETFLPLYAITRGLSAYEIGACLSAQIITLALTKPMMGRFSDRHGRPPQIILGALLGAACVAGLPLFGSFAPLLLLSIFLGLSLSIVTSATAAFIADLSRSESHGSAMGVLGSVMDIGHTTGPIAAGVLAQQYGFGESFLGAAAVLAVVALLFWLSVGRGMLRPEARLSG